MRNICDCEKKKKFDNLDLGDKCMIINQDQTTHRILKKCEKNIVEDECFLFLENVISFEVMFCLAKNFWQFDPETRFRILKETSVDPFLMPNLFESVCKAFKIDSYFTDEKFDVILFEKCLSNMKEEITKIIKRKDVCLWYWYPGLRRSFYNSIKEGRFEYNDPNNDCKKKVMDTLINLAEELFPAKVRNDIGY